MPWFDIFWNDLIAAHIALHGLSYEDVEAALCSPIGEDRSDTSGLPIRFGFAIDGRKIAVVYRVIDSITVEPVTAYEVK